MTSEFGSFVARVYAGGGLVVQPRMGFAGAEQMRAGLAATKAARAVTAGTITLDSFTRLGDLAAADRALRTGADLNGYPIASHSTATTRAVLHGVADADFPVQVRHGSAGPGPIFGALVRIGLTATEGGPVSYCLPYGRTPLRESVANWVEACRILRQGPEPHMETFGGCLLGQLCPPSLLVAVSVLEALFFQQQGLRDLSVSYAQQTDHDQDHEAVLALRRLCGELLPATLRWHVVVYAYMGLYPVTPGGATLLLGRAARLAAASGAARLIVKTTAEAVRLPTIAENVSALEYAAQEARGVDSPDPSGDSQTYREAAVLIDAVLGLHRDLAVALPLAFELGYLDVPYCLHPDNPGLARSGIDSRGRLGWVRLGGLPLHGVVPLGTAEPITSTSLLDALSYMRGTFDRAALTGVPRAPLRTGVDR